jgi:transposase
MDDSSADPKALQRRIDELEAEVRRLTELVQRLTAALEQSQRSAKRQAAPFAKGPPRKDPKTPGRKAGDQHGNHGHRPPPPPDRVDETFEVELPPNCPHCGSDDLREDDVVVQHQTEIPRRPVIRQFNIHRGHCQGCGHTLQGRHSLQTSDAIGAAASQLGPDAQAAVVQLNKDMGLSHGKVARVFDSLLGIKLSRGASARIVLRAAKRLRPAYDEILDCLKASATITPDETGWRIGGQTVWLHAWVGVDGVTAYHIDPQRSSEALQRTIGIGWSGTLVHDGWSSYDAFEDAAHQQCQAHVLRRAHALEETAVGRAKEFPRQVITLLQESLALRDEYAALPPESQPDEETRAAAFEDFTDRLRRLTARPRSNEANERFAKHLHGHGGEWFVFLLDPSVPATNWMGEQAIRPAVVNRKVWGGNRTDVGAEAQSVTMSVLETCRRQTVDAMSFVSQTLRGVAATIFPSPRTV